LKTCFLEYFLDSWFFGAAFYLPAEFFSNSSRKFPEAEWLRRIPVITLPISAIPEGSVPRLSGSGNVA